MTNRRDFFIRAMAPMLLGRRAGAAPTGHTFGTDGDHFVLDGKAFVIRSGEMHYPRVSREYWRDRMKKMRALGLNTLCTYVFWNLHEPQPGRFDFSGNLDLAEYLHTAQQEGLWVLLRPGPYICSEWDFGGYPAWLLADNDMHVRSTDPKFLQAAERYMKRVGKEAASLGIEHGGPILAVQVENEYGSFGHDKVYMNAIRKMIVDAGFTGALYTADGSGASQLAGGTLDGVTSVINFGDTANVDREFVNFAKFRTGVPRMNGEYWCGWFDHWGEKHHVTSPQKSAAGVEWMLSRGISFNLYMVHGGTSWGYMSGANGGGQYEPDTSAYDYDAPIDEAGRPSKKFQAFRDVINKYLPAGERLPDLPSGSPVTRTVPRFGFKQAAPITAHLPKPHKSDKPLSMEAIGQSYGFILYRTKVARAVKGPLEVSEARDFAVISCNGTPLGTLDRRKKQTRCEVDLPAGAILDILVENLGRINFGPALVDDRKGIVGKVALNGEELTGWEIFPLPLHDASQWPFGSKEVSGPALHRGTFETTNPSDTFLDMRGWGKGVVMVNGRNAGRYWKIGPQQTLFIPASWMKRGTNEVIVLDLLEGSHRSVEGVKDPIYETPA
ncbi:MAG TPA: beta-galactosidase family protein [Bryobacteraceae bacterium]